MSMLETAAQEQCRRRIPEAAWTAFDIEFSRLKIKTWIFVVLWGFLGNFGGHLINWVLIQTELEESSVS